MAEFFHMGGYALYVWASYGAALLILGLGAFANWRLLRRSTARLEALRAAAPHRRRRAGRDSHGAQ